MPTRIQLRRGTAAEWAAANPVLADTEMGVERDTTKFKFGDGVTAWNALAYAGGGPGASGAVPDVEFFSGSTAVPDGFTNTNLAFVHLAPPGTDYHLLDLTDPTVPTIIEAGNYVFNMAVGGPQSGPYPSPTEFFWFGLDVTRPDGWGAYDDDVAPLVLTGTSRPVVTATVAYYCPAGTTITAAVRTNMAESYLLEGSIQMMARG